MIGDALLLAEAQQASALEAQASAERLQQDVERLKAEAAQVRIFCAACVQTLWFKVPANTSVHCMVGPAPLPRLIYF